MGITEQIKNTVSNILAWKTKRHLIVIESDDWGTVRVPSKKSYNDLAAFGINMKSNYNRFDTLETAEDLESLFEVLQSVRDSKGNNPIVTANCLVANPDFEKIKKEEFTQYFYEPVEVTMNRSGNAMNSWKEGMKNKLFFPQLHGREHLHFSSWMNALKNNHKPTRFAFEHGFFALDTDSSFSKRGHYLGAFDVYNETDLKEASNTLKDAMNLFEQLTGYRSETFIAPNYIWHSDMEHSLHKVGVKYIQGQRNQVEPILNTLEFKPRFHYTGQKNDKLQRYLVRNIHFEPSSSNDLDWVSNNMKLIASAFAFGTPAIISTHRVNFTGSIDEGNRTKSLLLLKKLLDRIVIKWPTVEFMTSAELGALINKPE